MIKNVCRQDVPKTAPMRFLEGGIPSAETPWGSAGTAAENRFTAAKVPKITPSDRNLLRKSVKMRKMNREISE